MGGFRMDDLDRRLIGALRADGRAPLAKLAMILGVSRATVQNRLDRLIADGNVLGFTVRVRQADDAASVRAIMMIEVVGKSTAAVVRALRGVPEVEALHTTNGSWDLVVELQANGLVEFDRVLTFIRSVDGIANSQTSLLLSSYK
jgi:DNA-binding Lrp family transcriptional regulator